MSDYQEKHNDINPPLTAEENEHRMHKAEGRYFQWCQICVMEEICSVCKGEGFFQGKECEACESSGRKI